MIFECFSYFWKVFCFCKKFQKFQKHCYPVLATQSRVGLVAYPSCEPTQRFFVAHWRVNVPVTKNTQNIFQNLGFNVSRDSVQRHVREWKVQSRRDSKKFCGLPCDSLVGRTSSRKKHLDKFFKIYVLSVLATGPSDLLTT